MNHDFNIGNCDNRDEHQEWWKYLLDNNVIAAGFDGEPLDDGERILRKRIGEGELIFAYASLDPGYHDHGYVGVGLAKSRETYKLLDPSMPQPHRRDIQWLYYVESLGDAMPAKEIGVPYPVSTWQSINDDKAEKILRAFWQNPKTVIRFTANQTF
ncbi:MAG: hypothetical protein WCL34_15775 [Methylococcaceae bacterium]